MELTQQQRAGRRPGGGVGIDCMQRQRLCRRAAGAVHECVLKSGRWVLGGVGELVLQAHRLGPLLAAATASAVDWRSRAAQAQEESRRLRAKQHGLAELAVATAADLRAVTRLRAEAAAEREAAAAEARTSAAAREAAGADLAAAQQLRAEALAADTRYETEA